MKLNQIFSPYKISKNLEFFFVLILILISIAITLIYNSSKSYSEKQYVNLIDNLYFQKTVKDIFNNLSPKYHNIEHQVLKNETLNSVLKSYDLPDNEIEF